MKQLAVTLVAGELGRRERSSVQGWVVGSVVEVGRGLSACAGAVGLVLGQELRRISHKRTEVQRPREGRRGLERPGHICG